MNITQCTTTCGGEMINQTRMCDDPAPSDGGSRCNTSDNSELALTELRTIQCGDPTCPGMITKLYYSNCALEISNT